jgi:hypothetical protein
MDQPTHEEIARVEAWQARQRQARAWKLLIEDTPEFRGSPGRYREVPITGEWPTEYLLRVISLLLRQQVEADGLGPVRGLELSPGGVP